MRGPAQRRILAARIRPDGRQVLRVCQRVWVDYHTGDGLFPGLTLLIFLLLDFFLGRRKGSVDHARPYSGDQPLFPRTNDDVTLCYPFSS